MPVRGSLSLQLLEQDNISGLSIMSCKGIKASDKREIATEYAKRSIPLYKKTGAETIWLYEDNAYFLHETACKLLRGDSVEGWLPRQDFSYKYDVYNVVEEAGLQQSPFYRGTLDCLVVTYRKKPVPVYTCKDILFHYLPWPSNSNKHVHVYYDLQSLCFDVAAGKYDLQLLLWYVALEPKPNKRLYYLVSRSC